MSTTVSTLLPHPEGEQPTVEEFSATAETFAGRVHVEWDSDGLVTPLGQLPFFVEYLKQAGLFAGWVADCPLTFSSPNAPSKRDLNSLPTPPTGTPAQRLSRQRFSALADAVGSIAALRKAAFGATLSLARIPAKVGCPRAP